MFWRTVVRWDEAKPETFRNSEEWGHDIRLGVNDLIVRDEKGGRRLTSFSGKERNHLFLNANGTFADVSPLSGLDSPADGRSFTYWDYDRDGWLDIAVVNSFNPLLNLYRNRLGSIAADSRSGRAVMLRFVGGNATDAPHASYSCRDGVGAKVRVELGDKTLFREYRCGEGFAAQNTATMHLGVGDTAVVPAITVQWPSGITTTITDVDSGTLLTAFENVEESSDGSGFDAEPYSLPSRDTSTMATVPPASEPDILSFAETYNGPARLQMFVSMATWCPSCRKHLPQIRLLANTFGDDLAVMGCPIDAGETKSKLNAYVVKYQPAYELKTEFTAGERSEFKQRLFNRIRGDLAEMPLPATILTDRQGNIVAAIRGVPTVSDIAQWVRQVSAHETTSAAIPGED